MWESRKFFESRVLRCLAACVAREQSSYKSYPGHTTVFPCLHCIRMIDEALEHHRDCKLIKPPPQAQP